MAFLVHKSNGSRTTLSWARYLMCVELGRILEADEHVDHIDENKLHDEMSNLQILTPSQNTRKSARKRGRLWIELVCLGCEEHFFRPKNQTHLSKGGRTTSCSRKCRSKVLSSGLNEEARKRNVIREYRKH